MTAAKGVAPKVVVVMPAYNAGRTLRLTYEELPKESVNLVILVDDGSTDKTLDIARELGLEIFVHVPLLGSVSHGPGGPAIASGRRAPASPAAAPCCPRSRG